jgi:hypothetical protein
MGDVANASRVPSSQSSWKILSRDSKQDNSAPIQSIPGAIRDNKSRFAPTPNGTIITTIKKNDNVKAKPPPDRMASLMSRKIRGHIKNFL